MATYRLILEADNGEDVTFTPLIEVSTEGSNPELEAQIRAATTATVQTIAKNIGTAKHRLANRVGRKAKPILITAVEDEANAPAGIYKEAVFPSSMELSMTLGYNYNMVTQILSRNRQSTGAVEATLRGVTFRYLEDAPEKV